LLAVTLALIVALVALPCRAHAVGVSRGEYRAVAAGLELELTFAASEVLGLGHASKWLERIEVRNDAPCSAEWSRVEPLDRDGVRITAWFRCSGAGALSVSLAPLFRELARGHRHEAIVRPSGASTLLFEAQPELVLEAAPQNPSVVPGPPTGAPRTTSFFGFVRLGVEHILTGYDHLVFLLGLVVIGLRTKRTLVVASAFTLAHSLSLAASVLGLVSPPSAIVEPAIALSIAYVGIENLVRRRHERRAELAFVFGLIHGFGFASALEDVEFRGFELLVALGGFNSGVELGQLVVLAALLPLVRLVRARPAFARLAIPAVSAAVAVSGAVWLVA
jgi:hydrogenase/urease accessory protein HupE